MKKSSLHILALSLLATSLAWAQSSDMRPETAVWGTRKRVSKPGALAPELRNLRSDDPALLDVIVQFTQVPTARHHQKVTDLGGSLKRQLSVIKGASYHMPASAVATLAEDPEVVYISPDRALKGLVDITTATVYANLIYDWGITASGVGVAVIDSGVTPVQDLAKGNNSRVVYSQDFVGSGGTNDLYGHGTHVAGIIASDGAMSTGSQYTRTFRGFAPGASIVNLRVLDQNGNGTDSGVVAGIDEAIQLKNQYNIRVINLSLGRPVFESYKVDPLCQAVEAAWNAGIVVVVAAGNMGRDDSFNNNGYGTIEAPGNDPYVITVGAMKDEGTVTRSDDLMTSYSSKGPTPIDHIVKPDLVAPGNREISLLAPAGQLIKEYPQTAIANSVYMSPAPSGNSSNYFMLSGTSMATPAVSGTAALMLAMNPFLTPDTVKARLMKTATKNFPVSSVAVDPTTGISYVTYYDIFTVGAGYLDSFAAITSMDTLPWGDNAMSPTAVENSRTGQVTLVTGNSVVWGTSLVWGTSVVWGTAVLSGNSVVWGTSLVWGTSNTSAFSLIWGTSVVWGTSTPTTETSTILVYGEP